MGATPISQRATRDSLLGLMGDRECKRHIDPLQDQALDTHARLLASKGRSYMTVKLDGVRIGSLQDWAHDRDLWVQETSIGNVFMVRWTTSPHADNTAVRALLHIVFWDALLRPGKPALIRIGGFLAT